MQQPQHPQSYSNAHQPTSQYPQQQHQQQHQQQPYGQPHPHQPQQYGQSPPHPQPYTQQTPPMGMNPNFLQGAATQLMMDPNAWSSIGQHAFVSGQQYVDKNLNRWINWPVWKYYWNVSNFYVMKKIALILFPFRHASWTRLAHRSEINGQNEGYKPPRHDINAPDLYIPVMSFVTYVILVGLLMGTEQRFTPEVLTLAASTAMVFTLIEVFYLRLGIYLLSVNMQELNISLADLLAYSAYQFVSVIIVQSLKFIILDFWINVVAYGYVFIAFGWFSLRSLRYILFPSSSDSSISTSSSGNTKSTLMRKTRVNFLFSYVLLQLVLCWFLVK